METETKVDGLIAKNVMGWERREDAWQQEFWVTDGQEPSLSRGNLRRLTEVEYTPGDVPLFRPSVDIVAAMEVVDHVLDTWHRPTWEPEFALDCRLDEDEKAFIWRAHFGADPFPCDDLEKTWLSDGEAETRPLAICLAALALKGIGVDGRS